MTGQGEGGLCFSGTPGMRPLGICGASSESTSGPKTHRRSHLCLEHCSTGLPDAGTASRCLRTLTGRPPSAVAATPWPAHVNEDKAVPPSGTGAICSANTAELQMWTLQPEADQAGLQGSSGTMARRCFGVGLSQRPGCCQVVLGLGGCPPRAGSGNPVTDPTATWEAPK